MWTQSGVYYNIFTLPRQGDAGGVPSGTAAYYVPMRILFASIPRHPPYTKGSHNSDVRDQESGGRLTEIREQVAPLLEAGGVDMVL